MKKILCKKLAYMLLIIIINITGVIVKVKGQVSITNRGTAYTENFTIGNSGTATLPTGFKFGTDWSSGTTATTQAAGTSGTGVLTSTSSGGAYNFANGITASSTDRSIGFLTSGSYTSPRSIVYAFTNNTGVTITDLSITFDYEKYRSGSRAFAWTFFHGSSSSPSTSATSGDQSYSADADNTVIYNPPTTINKSVNLTSLSIANGTTYYLKWTYTGSGGSTNSQGIGIDNFSITATIPEPTTQASNISFSNITSNGMKIDWTSGNGENRVVFVKETSGSITNPTDGSSYSASNDWNIKGTQLGGSGYYCVYNSNGSTVTLTNLTSNTAYYVQIFEYNGSGTTSNYNISTATNNPNNQSTSSGSSSSSSDIIRNSVFSEPTNVAYGSYQESDLTSSSLEVAKFDIRDGGGSADADALGTTLTAITFSLPNYANIKKLAIYDNTTEISEVTVSSGSVAFSSLTGLTASDGGTKTFSLRASFNSTVTDNQQFQFTVSSATADAAGSVFAAAHAGAAASSVTGNSNRIIVTATKLRFVQQPTNTNNGSAMTPAVTVEATDANNNRDLDFSTNIIITSTGTLTGSSVSATATSGLATFSTLTHTVDGNGLKLNAERETSNDWDVESNTFNISTPSASIAISSPATASGNIIQESLSNIIYKINLAVTVANATLTGLTCTTAGTYSSTDIINFELWYNTSATLTGATKIGSTISSCSSGSNLAFTGLSQNIVSGNTAYIFVTCEVATGATVGNTINIASTAFSNITFSSGSKTGTDPLASGGIQTITALSTTCGAETFSNSNATSTYADGNFTGDNNVVWYYVASRDESTYSINGKGIMLRRSSDGSKVYSSSVVGGIGNFTCSLKKGFTGAGNRQVELFVNSVSKGTCTAWDNTTVQTFTVNNINVSGSVVIEIRNITANQVVVDDISWTCYGSVTGSSTISAGSGAEPTTFSSLIDTQGESVLNFDFTITDDGSTPTTDALDTKISQIIIGQGTGNDITDWTQAISGALLTDGTNTQTSNITINTNNISITSIANTSGNLGFILDNGNKTFTLKVWLKSVLEGTLPTTADGLNIVFDVQNSSFTFNGGSSLANSQDINSGGSNNAIEVIGTKLRFVQQPTNTNNGSSMTPAVTVEATDANNNRDLGFSTNIKITSTGTLTNSPVSVAAISGLATFNTLTHTIDGSGLKLNAERETSNDWDIESNTFNISTPTASVVISNNGTQIAASNVKAGTSDHILLKIALSVSNLNTTLTGLTCTTAGTYISDDITNLKVRYSADATLDAGDITLSTLNTPGIAGLKNFSSFTNQLIYAGTTGYIFITADFSNSATVGNTINVDAISSTNLTFSSGNISGSTTAGGAQTITPYTSSSSDIIASSSFTYPTNIAYENYQETDLTSSSLEVARFTIRDGGSTTNDIDVLSTTLTDITFSISNSENLRRIAIYDGTTEKSEINAGSTVTFNSISGLFASDNSTKEFSIRASFQSTVTDNQQFSFTITSATANSSGSSFAVSNAGGATSDVTGNNNKIVVNATKLLFVTQPSNVGVGPNISPAVTVEATDANNNRDLDFNTNLKIIASGASLNSSPIIETPLNGLATFSTLSFSTSGTGVTLTAQRNSTSDWNVNSSAFNVTSGAAISISGTPLYNFDTCYVNMYSTKQWFYVSGNNLTANITVTAPMDFEVSLSCSSGYGTTVILTQSGGIVSSTIVYARFKPTSTGQKSGNISCTSSGATNQNVSVSGTCISTFIPSNYYSTATGSGATLKTQLYNKISSHTKRSYTQLWTDLTKTDKKYNGKIWDMYSDNPCGIPAYEFTCSTDQCGTYSAEGNCYNREHSFPNSWFGGVTTSYMYTDLFHMIPTDGYVNNKRGNNPLGIVTNPAYTSSNGCKVGPNKYGSTYTGDAFEPLDEYKGDFARAYFYMVTCYENVVASWETFNAGGDAMLDGTAYPAFEPWALDMLIEWNNNDPVSQKEIKRNQIAYRIQGNRNPFIDHPEYVNAIWGSSCSAPATGVTLLTGGTATSTTIPLSWVRGNGDNIIVVARQGSAVNSDPISGTSYTANAAFGSGSQIGSGNFVIYKGTGTSVTVTGLNAYTNYYFVAYEFNNTGVCYNIAGKATANSTTTTKAEPTNHPTSFTCGTTSTTEIPLTWIDASVAVIPDGYLIKSSSVGYGSITDPIDGTAEANSSTVYNISQGTQTYTFQNLVPNTTYYFKIYPYSNNGTNINYKTDGTVLTTSCATQISTGCSADLIISEYVEGSSSNKYIEIYNGTGVLVNLANYSLRLYANGASSPTQDIALSGTLSDHQTVVLKNSSATIYSGTATSNNAVAFTGNDALVLYKSSTSSIIDIIGRIGEDPGSTGWISGSYSTTDKTLVRKSNIITGITTNPTSGFPTLSTEWNVYNTDVVTNLGSHNMSCCTPPDNQATNFTSSNITNNSVTISWTRGNGSNVLIVAKAGSAVNTDPSSGLSYVADADFGSGTLIGSGNYVVYDGNGTSTVINSLNPGTTYHFAIYEYSTGNCYKTPALTGNVTTLNINDVTNLSINCVTNNSMSVSWTPPTGSYDGVVIALRNSTNTPHSVSGSGITYTANSIFESGYQFGTTTPYSYVVYNGTGSSVVISNLIAGQPYTLKAYTYTGSIWSNGVSKSTQIVGLSNVSSVNTTAASGQLSFGWINPLCYDEIMIIMKAGSSVTVTPTGDGTLYTANSVFSTGGSGTNLPTNEYAVYKNSVNSAIITGLSNNTTYYYKIFTRKGSEWSSGIEGHSVPSGSTVLEQGDLAFLSFNSNNSNSKDELSFVCFKDITDGTSIDFTDNGYERKWTEKWGSTEGVIRFTRNGGTITAGTVITFVGTGHLTSDFSCSSPDNNWTISILNASYDFNLNSTDQIWILQGGTWATVADHKSTYSGNVLSGFTTSGWHTGDPGGTDLGTSQSNLYPSSMCFSMNVGSGEKVKYTGPTDPGNQITWLIRFKNPANWTKYSTNAEFIASSTPQYSSGYLLSIISSGIQEGKWEGNVNSDWMECGNWSDMKVPTANSNIYFYTDNCANDIILKSGETAVCNNFTISGSSSTHLINGKNGNDKILEINGDLIIEGPSALSYDDGNNSTSDGYIKIKGNWINRSGKDNFVEGNSTVEFSGTNQSITEIPNLQEQFNSLIFSNSGTKTLNSKIIANNITVSGSASLAANGFDIENKGNWANTSSNAFIPGTSASVTFNGTSAQSISWSGGSENFYNVNINNVAGINLAGNTIINGSLTLTNGNFSIGNYGLTIKNPILVTPNNLTSGASSSLTIDGSASGINVPSSVNQLLNFTLNNSNGTTLQSDLLINNSMTLTSGAIILNNKTLTINGSVSGNGTLSCDDQAHITIGGNSGGSAGTIHFTGSSNTLAGFTLNRTGVNASVSFGSDLTISGSGGQLTLTNGDLNVTNCKLTFQQSNNPITRTNGTISYGSNSTLAFGSVGNTSGNDFVIPDNLFSNTSINNLIVYRQNKITLGNQNITINGNLELIGGLLDKGTSSNIIMGNNSTIIRSGGSLSASPTFGTSVNIQYNAPPVASSITTDIELPSSTSVLNNLTINNISGVVLNTNTTVNGSLILTSGALIIGSNTLNLNGTVSSTTGTITGGSNSDIIIGGSSGGNLGSIPFTSGSETLRNLTLNRSGANSKATLSSNITIENAITLTSGKLDLSSNTLTLGTNISDGSISGYSSSNYIIATSGKLRRHTNSLSTIYNFPVGDASNYSPFTIEFTSGTLTNPYIEVNVTNSKHPKLDELGGNITNYINRYWTYEPSGITSPLYNVTFSYADADIVGDETHIYPVKKNTAGWLASKNSDPTYHPLFTMGDGSNNPAANTLTWTGVYTFSDGTGAGGSGGALPVELLDFKAKFDNSLVELKWTTASETNNNFFTIERSTDATNFRNIDIVKGAGCSNKIINYSYIDKDYKALKSNVLYYRLKQTDFNGIYKYSKTEVVQIFDDKINSDILNVNYDDISKQLIVSINSSSANSNEIFILDILGNIKYKKNINIDKGFNTIYIPFNSNKGVYFINLIINNKLYSKKFAN